VDGLGADNGQRIIELTLLVMSVGVIAYALHIVQDFVARAVGVWRTTQGRCSQCAYDLRGSMSETCPECGTGIDERCATQRRLHS